MSQIEGQSPPNALSLSQELTQSYEDLNFTLYSPGVFKGVWRFFKTFVKLFLIYIIFAIFIVFFCLCAKSIVYLFFLKTIQMINENLNQNFYVALIVESFALCVTTGSVILILWWTNYKFSKTHCLVKYFYKFFLIFNKALFYIATPLVAASALSLGYLSLKSNVRIEEIIFALFLGFTSTIIFMFLSFLLYRPLFRTDKGTKFSSSVKDRITQELEKIPKNMLQESWISSFFYAMVNRIISAFFIFPYTFSFVLIAVISFVSIKLNYLLLLSFFIVSGLFLLPFWIHRYYPKGIVSFIHKLSCANMVQFFFPTQFFIKIIAFFSLSIERTKKFSFINFSKSTFFEYFHIESLKYSSLESLEYFLIYDIVFSFLLFYVTVKIYRKALNIMPKK
ncbi:hypothetical protein HE1_01125 [Holospora elegans E1]|uniref:Uncharacterized protein n=1 Tax=Holospora elegans E1 TaxID=1427503 RepID=A0A023DZ24_9PROT|nr:hypothetical protein HE1_01125 [Holospora elegans E1]